MKKLLFVHPDLRGGGAEKVLVNMLNSLDKTKYNITLLTVFDGGVNKKILLPHIKHIHVFKRMFKGWSILQKIWSPTFLFKYFIKDDYDIIIAYLEGVPTRIVGGCPTKKTKLIAWVHVDLTNFGIQRVFRSEREMERLYMKYDAIIGVSKTALNSLHNIIPSLPKTKLKVIHNILDTNLIVTKGNEPLDDIILSKNVINMCSVGRLAQQKGYPRLLNIVSKLLTEGTNFHLYIIGKGEQEQQLKQIIETDNLNNKVTLLGFKANPHKYVKNCDLFVCSSFQEGFSTAVTEAILLETPILTTNCAGMDEILVNGKYGMIVENSEQGLYKGLKAILNNPELLKHYKNLAIERSKNLKERNNIEKAEQLFDQL